MFLRSLYISLLYVPEISIYFLPYVPEISVYFSTICSLDLCMYLYSMFLRYLYISLLSIFLYTLFLRSLYISLLYVPEFSSYFLTQCFCMRDLHIYILYVSYIAIFTS